MNALKKLYPQLEVRTFAAVTSFLIPGEKQSVIDVTYPHRPDLAETLARPVEVLTKEGLRYRIPSLEAVLANKYGAMLTPSRALEKRAQDALDFAWTVKHSTDDRRQSIDLEKLENLGEKAWPGAAERKSVGWWRASKQAA